MWKSALEKLYVFTGINIIVNVLIPIAMHLLLSHSTNQCLYKLSTTYYVRYTAKYNFVNASKPLSLMEFCFRVNQKYIKQASCMPPMWSLTNKVVN